MNPSSDPSVLQDTLSLLLEKYPEIAFRFMHSTRTDQAEGFNLQSFWDLPQDLEHIDILFIYGIDCICHFAKIAQWVEQKRQKKVYILETQMGQIECFLQHECAKSMLLHPQIFLHYAEDEEELGVLIEDLAQSTLSDKVELIGSPSREKNTDYLEEIRRNLWRRVALTHALYTETIHYHLLVQNLIPNFVRGSHALFVNHLQGLFTGVPAVVCGAGPSLSSVMEHLKELKNKALIIAGGSAITALANAGVEAHIHMAIDPNDEEYVRLRSAQPSQVPLFFAPRVNAKIFDTTNAPLGLMSCGTGGELESYLFDKVCVSASSLGSALSAEALSVTTMAISLAEYMGCSSIFLCGVDLSFTDMRRYPEQVGDASLVDKDTLQRALGSLDRFVVDKDIAARPVYTQVRWLMEGQCLSLFAKQHPHIPLFRGTEAGLAIDGIAPEPLNKSVRLQQGLDHDLCGRLHALSVIHANISKENLDVALVALDNDLDDAITIIYSLLEEIDLCEKQGCAHPDISPRFAVLLMDLEETRAYDLFIRGLSHLLQRMLIDQVSTQQGHFLAAQRDMWKKILCVMQSIKETSSAFCIR